MRTLKYYNRKTELTLVFCTCKSRFQHFKLLRISLNVIIAQCTLFQIIFKMKSKISWFYFNAVRSQSPPSFRTFLFLLLGWMNSREGDLQHRWASAGVDRLVISAEMKSFIYPWVEGAVRTVVDPCCLSVCLALSCCFRYL